MPAVESSHTGASLGSLTRTDGTRGGANDKLLPSSVVRLGAESLQGRTWRAQVLKACALLDDLEAMAHGDATLVSTNGCNVSGGQRSRIALARAVYSPAETLGLGDPLAAPDRPVARHVFRRAVQAVLLSRRRTVIMTTHQLKVIDRYVDPSSIPNRSLFE